MNDYFNAPDDAGRLHARSTLGDQGDLRADRGGFDLLPARDALLQGRVNFAVAGGTANALTAAFAVAPESYVEGASFRLKLSRRPTPERRRSTSTASGGGDCRRGRSGAGRR
jgi:hypothetical protein